MIAITNQSKLKSGESAGPSLKRKPTLKRGDGDGSDDTEKDKPTLKRKPGSDN